MKAIAILVILLGAVCAMPADLVEQPFEINAEIGSNAFIDFVTGFLEGLNVKGDINKILECVKGGEGIIEKIIEAIKLIIHLDFKHLDDIIKGIKMLVEAVQDIIKIIQPCTQSVQEIQKLINALININFIKLAWKIITHAGTFIHDITDAIDAFGKKDYKRAGKDVGHLLFLLFLDGTLESDPVFNFIKGFLEGVNEKGDVKELLKCLKDVEPLINKIIEAIQLILTMKIDNIMKGVIELVQAVTELINLLQPCSQGFEQLEKLIEAIFNTDIMKIITKIIANLPKFIEDFTTCIQAFTKGDFETAGKALGDVFFRLYLQARMHADPFNFTEFVRIFEGFFVGFGNNEVFKKTTTCLALVPGIYQKFVDAINLIIHLDLHNIVDALIKVFQALIDVVKSVKPCKLVPEDIKVIVEKFKNINLDDLLNKITANLFVIIGELTNAINCLSQPDYFCTGQSIGNIGYVLFIK
jgi:hypothetical protein